MNSKTTSAYSGVEQCTNISWIIDLSLFSMRVIHRENKETRSAPRVPHAMD